MNGKKWTGRTLATAGCAFVLFTGASAMEKKVIESAADLPRVEFELGAKPSELLAGGPRLDALANEIEAYYVDLNENYDIRDAATKRGVLAALRSIADYEKRYADALAFTPRIRALEDKAAAKATTGLLSDAMAQAAIDVGADEGAAFEARVKELYAANVAAVDWAVAQDVLQATKSQLETLNPALIQGAFEGQFDQVAANLNGKFDAGTILTVIQSHGTITDVFAVKDEAIAVLAARIDAEKTEKEDRWSERTVTLAQGEGASTRIGVWDTGVDPALFKGRLAKTKGAYGVAYDRDFKKTDTALLPVDGQIAAAVPGLITLVKGSLDNQAGVDSAEAAQFRQTMASMEKDQVTQFIEQMGLIGNYIHGTAVAHVAAEGNPQARLYNARFSWPYEAIPPAMDEEWAEGLVRASRDAVAAFKRDEVRVVNMSWRVTVPMVEGLLAANGIESDPDARAERARKIFAIMQDGLSEAFASAPEILFVAGAGNEDENVEFVQSVPAGLNAENILTVGAVDQALEPAGFTSYGKAIDVYANGFETPTFAPGGTELNLSGTSLAAPQVANLAGKLFTLAPELSVAEVRTLIESTATEEGENALKVIDPRAAVAALKAS